MRESDRRREHRVNLVLSASINGSVPHHRTSDLSERGAFFVAQEAPTLGSTVEVDVAFPGLLEPKRLQGVVRWLKPSAGFGVEWREPISDPVLMAVLREGESEIQLVPSTATKPTYRMLVADDNKHATGMVKRSLSHHADQDCGVNLEVIESNDGRLTWDRLQERDIDLLFVERYLPVIDGITLLNRVRNTPGMRTMPVIMCSTGKTDTAVASRARGADLYVAKPFRLMDILETVYRFLRVAEK